MEQPEDVPDGTENHAVEPVRRHLEDDAPVAVAYTDLGGGTRTVRHAAQASVEQTQHRPGDRELLSSSRGAYEYGIRQGMPGIVRNRGPKAEPAPDYLWMTYSRD